MNRLVNPKTCPYCCHAKEATAVNRTILICNHKEGAERKFFVFSPNETCVNFTPARSALQPGSRSRTGLLIPLTQGKFAIVDPEDYDNLIKYKWIAHQDGKKYYAYRTIPYTKKKIAMHRQIMHAPKGLIVDHIDGDSLNNRRSNLHICTPAQNGYNRHPSHKSFSGYKGVYWHKHHGKWHVRITKFGRTHYLGSFADPAEAARAYDKKAKELFGEYAYLNFGKSP